MPRAGSATACLFWIGKEYAVERSAEQAAHILDRRKQRLAGQMSALEPQMPGPRQRLLPPEDKDTGPARADADITPALLDIREDYDQEVMAHSTASIKHAPVVNAESRQSGGLLSPKH